MEYSSDSSAAAAYVTDGANDTYGSSILTGGTATADSEFSGSYPASGPLTGGLWISNVTYPHWWKYDLSSGITKTARKLRIKMDGDILNEAKNFNYKGSNDNSTWTTIYTGVLAANGNWQDFTFSNTTAYRYYIINFLDTQTTGTYLYVYGLEMLELNLSSLQSYSESTIKTQGSYSLKAVAAATDSLNKTLTKTF